MNTKVSLLFFIVLAISLSCQSQLQFTKPIPVDNTFKHLTPTAQKLKHYRQAATYSANNSGYAVLVIEGDKIVFEEYQNGHTAETPSHIFSGTKSFAGVLAVAAASDGFIDIDEKVADTLTEFRKDDWKSQITVRHLLQFTSGIKQRFWMLTLDGMKHPSQQKIKDKYRFSLWLRCETKPGTNYKYGSSHLMVFGAFIKRKLKESPLDYLQRRIFTPLNFRYAGWHSDTRGNPALPYGAWTTAREWAKFGIFLKDDGMFRGKQVVKPGILKQCLQGSKAMPAYGLTFWLNNKVPENLRQNLIPQLKKSAEKGRVIYPQGPKDLYTAAGAKGNRLYIIPSRNMVVVRLGNGRKGYLDNEFLAYLLQ